MFNFEVDFFLLLMAPNLVLAIDANSVIDKGFLRQAGPNLNHEIPSGEPFRMATFWNGGWDPSTRRGHCVCERFSSESCLGGADGQQTNASLRRLVGRTKSCDKISAQTARA